MLADTILKDADEKEILQALEAASAACDRILSKQQRKVAEEKLRLLEVMQHERGI